MSKHTPAPWEMGRANRPAFANNGIWAGGFVICDMCNDGYGEEEQLANARLIASAPELLDALKEIVRLGEGILEPTRELDIARQAIAKAEGKQ